MDNQKKFLLELADLMDRYGVFEFDVHNFDSRIWFHGVEEPLTNIYHRMASVKKRKSYSLC